jgi:hypothetical protein
MRLPAKQGWHPPCTPPGLVDFLVFSAWTVVGLSLVWLVVLIHAALDRASAAWWHVAITGALILASNGLVAYMFW